MNDNVLRSRLRLALGGDYSVGDALPSHDGSVQFAALRSEVPALITVYPRAPQGPTPEALRTMIDRFRTEYHGAMAMPQHSSDVDGRAYLISDRPLDMTALDRLETGGPMPVGEAVRIVRDVARALAILHRRGTTHGSLDLAHVHLSEHGAIVSGIGYRDHGSAGEDLHQLGRIGYALMSGDLPATPCTPLSRYRRAVPPAFVKVIDSLLDPDPASRPASAEDILDTLDRVVGSGGGGRTELSGGIRIGIGAIGVALVGLLLFAASR